MLTIQGYMVVIFQEDPRISTQTPGYDPLMLLYPNNDEALQNSFCKSKNRKKHVSASN